MLDPDKYPPILYKYRDWSRPYSQRALTDREVYFASPKEFNDPFDCTIPFKYKASDLTDENVFMKMTGLLTKAHPDWDLTRIHQEAYESQLEGLIYDEQHISYQNEQRKDHFAKTFGILCLTPERNNILMWSHYASSNSGFCIGYDTAKLFQQIKGRMGPVLYQDSFPEFGLFDDTMEHSIKYSSIKASCWSYENEHRFLKPIVDGKTVQLSSDTIVEIILGINMEFKEKAKILEIVKKEFPHASVFDAQKNSEGFQIDLVPTHVPFTGGTQVQIVSVLKK